MRMRCQRGQVAAEMMGLVALAAFVIMLLVQTGVPKQISGEVERLVCQMAQLGDCAGAESVRGPGADVPEGADVQVFDAGNGTDIPGELVREDGQDPTGNAEVDAVHDNFQRIHDYFSTRFGRNSYDDEGAPLIATVRYREDPDLPFRNAYWDSERRQMVFGEGYAMPLDITAHEVTHAITEMTSGLEYQGQSGAINESLSDIFGSNLDPDDWELGEDLPGGAIRDMKNPERFDQPGHTDDYRDLPDDVDYGGVHINSGIPNRAYVHMVEKIGRDASEQIVYTAATEHLESDSGFEDFRSACLQAAEDRYGRDSAEYRGVDEAFAAVGLDGTWEP
jgi:bacillolysin/thermolysin